MSNKQAFLNVTVFSKLGIHYQFSGDNEQFSVLTWNSDDESMLSTNSPQLEVLQYISNFISNKSELLIPELPIDLESTLHLMFNDKSAIIQIRTDKKMSLIFPYVIGCKVIVSVESGSIDKVDFHLEFKDDERWHIILIV